MNEDIENVNEEEALDEELEDEEDPGEQYIDYDSEENEVCIQSLNFNVFKLIFVIFSNIQIEVKLDKNEVRKKASTYLENEAELSESEWGSADEDEKNLDVYEKELGDEDDFDKDKLQSELDRIRM